MADHMASLTCTQLVEPKPPNPVRYDPEIAAASHVRRARKAVILEARCLPLMDAPVCAQPTWLKVWVPG